MHFKSPLAIVLSLCTLHVAADMQNARYAHRRMDIVRRAGAAYNETDTRSVEIGAQVTSSSAVVATSSSVQVASTTSSVAAAVVSSSSLDQITAASTVIADSSTSAVITTSSVVVPSSVVTSSTSLSSSAAAVTTTAVAITSTVTSTSSSSTSSSTSTSTTTVQAAQTSTVRSTLVQSAVAVSSSTTKSSTKASTTASATASIAAAAATSSKLSVGKTAMIAIIVVASVIVGALAIWTIIRKWKLGPSKKFDERMQPLDFSPQHGLPDPFVEKTRRRFSNHSTSSADRQRRQFVNELDASEQEKYAYAGDNYLQNVPSHDFTADSATAGGIASSHYAAQAYDPYGYPPQTQDYTSHADEAIGASGYADLRRGPSSAGTNFAGMGAGAAGLQSASSPPHAHAQPQGDYEERLYHGSQDGHGQAQYGGGLHREPSLGRPTRGEGPYFAASQASQFGQNQRY